jgi:hypothetical protein
MCKMLLNTYIPLSSLVPNYINLSAIEISKMPKPKSTTQHHRPIGQNCRKKSIPGAKGKMKICTKHQIYCTIHELVHLQSEPCRQCGIDFETENSTSSG